jgi:hypothetical protein
MLPRPPRAFHECIRREMVTCEGYVPEGCPSAREPQLDERRPQPLLARAGSLGEVAQREARLVVEPGRGPQVQGEEDASEANLPPSAVDPQNVKLAGLDVDPDDRIVRAGA